MDTRNISPKTVKVCTKMPGANAKHTATHVRILYHRKVGPMRAWLWVCVWMRICQTSNNSYSTSLTQHKSGWYSLKSLSQAAMVGRTGVDIPVRKGEGSGCILLDGCDGSSAVRNMLCFVSHFFLQNVKLEARGGVHKKVPSCVEPKYWVGRLQSQTNLF